jgi:L-alanine-DL-glutamate epimerase-like enolase superfamily enzyme
VDCVTCATSLSYSGPGSRPAIRAARGFQPFNVYWFEEPTIPDDIKGHARIASEGGLPVACGENLHSIYEFRNLIVTTHGVHELHLQLLAAVPNPSYLEVHGFALERFILISPAITQGTMIAPNLPGHGVQFDWDALQAHAVR